MSKQRIQKLDIEQVSDIVAETVISESIDLGASYVHVGKHPVLGDVTIIATEGSRHAVVKQAS